MCCSVEQLALIYRESREAAVPVSWPLVSLLQGQVVGTAEGSVGGGLEAVFYGGSAVVPSQRDSLRPDGSLLQVRESMSAQARGLCLCFF